MSASAILPVEQGYNQWAATYDSQSNLTRDLDATLLAAYVTASHFPTILELGCGTGKNTALLARCTPHLTAVDFSAGMLAVARSKITDPEVQFIQADLNQPLPFSTGMFDLVTCNLVLEHIQHLAPLFGEIYRVLQPGGTFYLSELHPYKQYTGSGARIAVEGGEQKIETYTHHTSDYFGAAAASGFSCTGLKEGFDEDRASQVPRLLVLTFQKNTTRSC